MNVFPLNHPFRSPAVPIAALLLLALPPILFAHAILVESEPRDGAILAVSPGTAILRFNSRIEKGVTVVTLLDENGGKIPLPPGKRPGGPPERLVIPLPQLRPGMYRLQYRVLAADGHSTPGRITFTIRGETK